jgi:hypothetical protein
MCVTWLGSAGEKTARAHARGRHGDEWACQALVQGSWHSSKARLPLTGAQGQQGRGLVAGWARRRVGERTYMQRQRRRRHLLAAADADESAVCAPSAFSVAAFVPSPKSASSHPAHWRHHARESQPACRCTHAAQSGGLPGGWALSRASPWFTSRNPVRIAKKKTPVLRHVGRKADQLLRVAERGDTASGTRAGGRPGTHRLVEKVTAPSACENPMRSSCWPAVPGWSLLGMTATLVHFVCPSKHSRLSAPITCQHPNPEPQRQFLATAQCVLHLIGVAAESRVEKSAAAHAEIGKRTKVFRVRRFLWLLIVT